MSFNIKKKQLFDDECEPEKADNSKGSTSKPNINK